MQSIINWILNHKLLIWQSVLVALAFFAISCAVFSQPSKRIRIFGGVVSLFSFLLILAAGLFYLYRPHVEREFRSVKVSEIDAQPPLEPADGDWPWWRGPDRNNRVPDTTVPVEWSSEKNVIWRADVPGCGHSSPAVVGESIILTTADETDEVQYILGFSRDRGSLMWQTEVHRGGFTRKHVKNSYASSSPASDGKRIYAVFSNHGELVVTALDFNGKVVWQKSAGPYDAVNGYGSSPVLYRSLVIVPGEGEGEGPFLAALDGSTGEFRWRNRFKKSGSNYGTPIIASLAGRDQLLLPTRWAISSYNPSTGEELWFYRWDVERMANTPTVDSEHVFASATEPRPFIFCIRADGKGEISEERVVWKGNRGASQISSPLVADGKLFVVTDNAIVTCLDAASGEVFWRQRLGGSVSSSPVLVGDKIFLCSEEGKVFVFRAASHFELLATNDLAQPIMATPAIVGDRIYLRTADSLWCIGSSERDEEPAGPGQDIN